MGDRIRQLREERGLSRYALAHLIHCEPISILLWEDGNTRPSAWALERVAAYFGVSVAYLLDGEAET